ncbi:hypothetical protein CHARACLAT_017883 [Characodon lateralis]|uniref:Uncharacterized protein n=1 Tax=Characodon lateralis TaxID=208331 RepID=A0ABU7DJF1_9TELE|nr:hypothetical protein [Characodon lateralis]
MLQLQQTEEKPREAEALTVHKMALIHRVVKADRKEEETFGKCRRVRDSNPGRPPLYMAARLTSTPSATPEMSSF